ncbi:MAG: FkbM family methyltransferase [Putridiphycobacter sp.]
MLKDALWNVSIPDSRYIIGNYEPNLADVIKGEMEKGKQLIDIGANAGYFSILASNYGDKSIEHFAFEPMPENLNLLKQHIKANHINNIKVYGFALSDKNGEIEFSNSKNLAANTYKQESSMFRGEKIKVKTIQLDSFEDKDLVAKNCFLKIDVEGAELDVLNGAKKFLEVNKPNLLLATHDCHVKNVKRDCLIFLENLGYSCQVLDDIKIDGQEDFLCKVTGND